MPTDSPIAVDDEWFRGTDKVLQFSITDAAGAPQVITGWTLQFSLTRSRNRRSALLTKTVGGGIAITNGPGGVCQVTIADTDTDNLDGSDRPDYWYELRRMDPGNEDILAYGTVVLREAMSL